MRKTLLFLLFPIIFGKITKEQEIKNQFDNFLELHQKHYENIMEYTKKLDNFNHNIKLIQTNNKDYDNCKLYLNKNSDTEKGLNYVSGCYKKNLRASEI